MSAIFCPACNSILAAPAHGSGPRIHCPQCGAVITQAGLGAAPPPCTGPLITEAMLREWHDRFPFAPQPFATLARPRAF
jgi:ribosomal protein S27E